MIVRYRGNDYEVPQHYNLGFFNHCPYCPKGTCIAPISTEEKIESLTSALTETCWSFEERKIMRQELRKLGVDVKDIPATPDRSNHEEKCSRCHMFNDPQTLVIIDEKLYCPVCAADK